MIHGLGSQWLGTQVDAFGSMSVPANAHVCVGTNCICVDAPMATVNFREMKNAKTANPLLSTPANNLNSHTSHSHNHDFTMFHTLKKPLIELLELIDEDIIFVEVILYPK